MPEQSIVHKVINIHERQRQAQVNFLLFKTGFGIFISLPCAVLPTTPCVPHQTGLTRFSSLLVLIKSNKNFPKGSFGNYHCMEFDETQRECHIQLQYFYIVWRLSNSPLHLWTLQCSLLKEITCVSEVIFMTFRLTGVFLLYITQLEMLSVHLAILAQDYIFNWEPRKLWLSFRKYWFSHGSWHIV